MAIRPTQKHSAVHHVPGRGVVWCNRLCNIFHSVGNKPTRIVFLVFFNAVLRFDANAVCVLMLSNPDTC